MSALGQKTPAARNPSCFNLTELNDEDHHQDYLCFAITLFAAAPAAFAQSWGNASTPGASQLKDDQSTITTTLNNYRVPYTHQRTCQSL
jgi:hypothetical protein